MAASGIPVSCECVERYKELNDKKDGYLLMSIKDNKEVVVDECDHVFSKNCTEKENEEAFNTLREKILSHEQEPKYIVFEFKRDTNEGRREKVGIINWCSDNCPINKRTVHGTTVEAVKRAFNASKIIQANDAQELDYKEIADNVFSK